MGQRVAIYEKSPVSFRVERHLRGSQVRWGIPEPWAAGPGGSC